MNYSPLSTKITSRWSQYQSLCKKGMTKQAGYVMRKLLKILRGSWEVEKLQFLYECCQTWHNETIVINIPQPLFDVSVLRLVRDGYSSESSHFYFLLQCLNDINMDSLRESQTAQSVTISVTAYSRDTLRTKLLKECLLFWLSRLRYQIQNAPGHNHLYDPFVIIIDMIRTYREHGISLDKELAGDILETMKLLVRESSQGRRPWIGGGELYLWKCMSNAYELLQEFIKFTDFKEYIPCGFSSILTFNMTLDGYADTVPQGCLDQLTQITLLTSEMFSLLADNCVQIDEGWLEHSDDRVFTYVLTGFARTGKARAILEHFIEDDETWVRTLAGQLLSTHYATS